MTAVKTSHQNSTIPVFFENSHKELKISVDYTVKYENIQIMIISSCKIHVSTREFERRPF